MTPALPPLAAPAVLDEHGRVWVADPATGEGVGWHLHSGLRLSWTPASPDVAILNLLGAQSCDPDFEEEGFACAITRGELRALIADLQSIDAQLGPGT